MYQHIMYDKDNIMNSEDFDKTKSKTASDHCFCNV